VGASDIVVFGNTFQSSMNFAVNTSGTLCGFSSVFQNIQQFDSFTPDCIEATSDACVRDVTTMPSGAQSNEPTPILTDAVSIFPSTQPAATPYPMSQQSGSPSLNISENGDVLSPTGPPVDFVFPDTSVPTSGNMQSTRSVMTILGVSLLLGYLLE
jgi:hypothetical protein